MTFRILQQINRPLDRQPLQAHTAENLSIAVKSYQKQYICIYFIGGITRKAEGQKHSPEVLHNSVNINVIS